MSGEQAAAGTGTSQTVLEILTAAQCSEPQTGEGVLFIANDADPEAVAEQVRAARVIALDFPVFTDGRAFSQAVVLRRRLGFAGVIRATGDVLIDQLQQMQRTGFTQAVLREDQDAEHGSRLLAHYDDFYQGDSTQPLPAFRQAEQREEQQ